MANRTVTVEITTEKRSFPVGTVSTKFKYEIIDKNNTVLSTITTDALGVYFPGIPEANGYVARVTGNGVVATTTFDLPVTGVTLDVPVSVSVSF